jgi:hypothetical protein
MTNRTRKTIGLIAPGMLTITILALIPSTQLSIDDSCHISGRIEELKTRIQGKRYWVNQLQMLDKEVRYLEASPEMREKLRRALQAMDERAGEIHENSLQVLEEQYLKHPELRAEREFALAQELRKQADSVERTAALNLADRLIADRNAERLLLLKSCRPVILAATE